MNETHKEQLLIILSSPSGAGKSTLARLLAKFDPKIQVSISATTRSPRDNENEGKEYFFISKDEFQQKIEQGQFLEHAEVFGNLYGTPLKFIEDCQMKNLDVVFDIDWQGSQQIKASKYKKNVVSIFILPPSIKELNNRLESRGADSRSMIKGRMEKCRDEISHWKDYQYVLINTHVAEIMEQIWLIVSVERLKRSQRKLADFVDKLDVIFDKELNNRLESKGADSRSMIKEWMDEISHWKDYQNDLNNAHVNEVTEQIWLIILEAERLKRSRRKGLANFIDKLNNELKDKNS